MEKILDENYFKKMTEKLAIEKITVEEYKSYFLQLKKAITNEQLKNPIVYVNALVCATVSPIKNDFDHEMYITISSELDDLITYLAQKEIKNINLDEYYNKIKNILNLQTVPSKEFLDYCKLLTLAYLAKVDTVNLKEWAKIMIEAKVTTETYDETRKVHLEKQKLNMLLQHFERMESYKKEYKK